MQQISIFHLANNYRAAATGGSGGLAIKKGTEFLRRGLIPQCILSKPLSHAEGILQIGLGFSGAEEGIEAKPKKLVVLLYSSIRLKIVRHFFQKEQSNLTFFFFGMHPSSKSL